MALVFTCPDGAAHIAPGDVPTCDQGQGAWIELPGQSAVFDPSQLDASELGEAFGVAFTVMGSLLVLIWTARMILRAI